MFIWGDTMAKYRVGDGVYPIDCDELTDLKELSYMFEFNEFDFVGIITEVDSDGEYSVAWLNHDRTEYKSIIKTAWWEENELTNDRELFLYQFKC